MRWRTNLARELDRENALEKKSWHRWFAWFPVRVDLYTIVWLEDVERYRSFSSSANGYLSKGYHWRYRVIKEEKCPQSSLPDRYS